MNNKIIVSFIEALKDSIYCKNNPDKCKEIVVKGFDQHGKEVIEKILVPNKIM